MLAGAALAAWMVGCGRGNRVPPVPSLTPPPDPSLQREYRTLAELLPAVMRGSIPRGVIQLFDAAAAARLLVPVGGEAERVYIRQAGPAVYADRRDVVRDHRAPRSDTLVVTVTGVRTVSADTIQVSYTPGGGYTRDGLRYSASCRLKVVRVPGDRWRPAQRMGAAGERYAEIVCLVS